MGISEVFLWRFLSVIAFLFFQQLVDFLAKLVVTIRHLPGSFATKGAIKEAAPNNHGEEGNAIVKKEENWMIGLDSLSEINEILEKGGAGTEEGLAYRDFLRILLNLHPVRAQKKRGLDLAELSMRAEGFSQFRADFCIAGMKDKIRWTFRPVFGRVTSAFFGLGSGDGHMVTEGGYTYY